jgi:hypothetical protein
MIVDERYYFCNDESGLGVCMVLKEKWHSEFIKIIEDNNVAVLRISDAAGWQGSDVSFISSLRKLKGLDLYSSQVKDLSPIYFLNELQSISLQCKPSHVFDLSVFKKLKICRLSFSSKIDGIFECSQLIHLNITSYPYENLSNLHCLSSLQRLQITSKKILNLNGVCKLVELKCIDLACCTNLVDISELKNCVNLEKIELTTCKKFKNLPLFERESKLISIEITDCGLVSSLVPLEICKHLKEISATGDTNIVDGNFDFVKTLKSIENVWYANKKHYSIARELLNGFIKIPKK